MRPVRQGAFFCTITPVHRDHGKRPLGRAEPFVRTTPSSSAFLNFRAGAQGIFGTIAAERHFTDVGPLTVAVPHASPLLVSPPPITTTRFTCGVQTLRCHTPATIVAKSFLRLRPSDSRWLFTIPSRFAPGPFQDRVSVNAGAITNRIMLARKASKAISSPTLPVSNEIPHTTCSAGHCGVSPRLFLALKPGLP